MQFVEMIFKVGGGGKLKNININSLSLSQRYMKTEDKIKISDTK